MSPSAWLLLSYKVPPEPAKGRVALWRSLKGMGAVYLQSGVCLLPKTDDHVRRLQMLENDIAGMQGEAAILETGARDGGQEEEVEGASAREGNSVSVRAALGGVRIRKTKKISIYV